MQGMSCKLVCAQVEAIKLLVRLGCEATVQDNVASTPLHVAAGEGHLDAIATLVSLVSRTGLPCQSVYYKTAAF